MDETLADDFESLMFDWIRVTAPVLTRADTLGLITPTEQAEITALQARFIRIVPRVIAETESPLLQAYAAKLMDRARDEGLLP